MKRLTPTLLLATWITFVGAQEQIPTREELFAFIYESLSASVPEKWEKAWMEANIGANDGVENISVKYFYLTPGSSQPKKFLVTNTFGPPNAARYLKVHAERDGKSLSSFRVEIDTAKKVVVIPLPPEEPASTRSETRAPALPAFDASSFVASNPEHQNLHPVVEWMAKSAPKQWSKLKFTYAYADVLVRVHAYAMTAGSKKWEAISQKGGFEIFDFFEAYRADTRSARANPWTAVIVVIDAERKRYDVAFCNATPAKDDILLETDRMGC